MRRKPSIPLIILILFIFSCSAMKEPASIGYFETEPNIAPFEEKVDGNLTIILMPEIKDSTLINRDELIKHLMITEFRKTIQQALSKTFSNSFNDIKFSDQSSELGVSLVLYRVEPFWYIDEYIAVTRYGAQGEYTDTKYEIASRVNYKIALYQDGDSLLAYEGEVKSDTTTRDAYGMNSVLKDGIKVFCEELFQETIHKIK